MSDYTTQILVALIGSGVWVSLIELLKEKINRKSADKQMILGLGHDRLYQLCEHYIDRGYVTVDELENLEYLYVPYKKLGGNGTGERLFNQVNSLPHHPPFPPRNTDIIEGENNNV